MHAKEWDRKEKVSLIFVTVGTHEQPFNRLLKSIDELCKNGIIHEPVIMQTGFSTYTPQLCTYEQIIPYPKMKEFISDARIVITHGGPASFLLPLQMGKIPIVVPRQLQFHEHVNNHQVEFAKSVSYKLGNILPVYNISQLGYTISHYDELSASLQNQSLVSNNERFITGLNQLTDNMFKINEHRGKRK